jgi:peptidyl-prolyl cis-trans isomerase C
MIAAVMALALGAGCALGQEEPQALAIVNGKPITETELEFRWSELPEATQAHYRQNGGKQKFLEELISRELLLQEAHRRGLDQAPVFRERLERVKERLVLDELMREAVKAKVELTENELESYYAAHPEAIPDEDIRAAHVVVSSLAEAKYIRKQLDGGADFGKLAQRFSIDPATRSKHGDLGLYQKGSLGPEFDAALLALRPGTVSEPVKTDAGFHLIRVISRSPGDPQSVQAARDRLRQELYAEKQQTRCQQVMSELRTAATIRVADTSRLATEEPEPLVRMPTP